MIIFIATEDEINTSPVVKARFSHSSKCYCLPQQNKIFYKPEWLHLKISPSLSFHVSPIYYIMALLWIGKLRFACFFLILH